MILLLVRTALRFLYMSAVAPVDAASTATSRLNLGRISISTAVYEADHDNLGRGGGFTEM